MFEITGVGKIQQAKFVEDKQSCTKTNGRRPQVPTGSYAAVPKAKRTDHGTLKKLSPSLYLLQQSCIV